MGNKSKTDYQVAAFEEQNIGTGSSFSTATVRSKWTDDMTRSGADDPKYAEKIANFQSASNAMLVRDTKVKVLDPASKLYMVYGGPSVNHRGKEFYSQFCGWRPDQLKLSPASLDVQTSRLRANAKNAAAIGIRSKIQQETSQFSGMTFLGELHQTVSLIRNPAKLLREYTNLYLYKMLVNKRFMRKRSFSKALSESWLEFSFGAMPFINDISAIANASLGTIEERRVKRLSYMGLDESAGTTSSIVDRGGLVGHLVVHRTNKRVARHFYTVGYEVEVRDTESRLRNIVEQGRFNLQDVVPTAWNLLPWSFFLDYFGNIGDVLGSTMVSLEGVRWVNSVNVLDCTDTIHNVFPKGGTATRSYSRGKMPDLQATYRRVEREDHPSIPFGELRFELPGRNVQFLNIAALARLQFK